MKNLSKRNKTLLGIGAVLVIVVVGLLVLKPPPIDRLLGLGVVSITPANPTITQGQTITLSVNPSALCTWSSQAGVVVGSAGASTTVQGVSIGTFTVSAKCPLGTAITNVIVTAPPTPTLTPQPTSTPLVTPTRTGGRKASQ